MTLQEGRCLRLEPLAAVHLPGLTALWSEPAVIRYTKISHLLSREEAAWRLDQLRFRQAALPAPTVFAVLEADRFCGLAGCLPLEGKPDAFGLFYQLLPGCWGRGIGLASARMALAELRRRFPQAAVYADVAAENAASIRILERLGFVRTAVRPGAFYREGRAMDIWEYLCRPGGLKEESI